MEAIEMFNILDSIDSTNNYAMAKVHAGLAIDGMAWFAKEQTKGRGQQGKTWESRPGENIALSIAVQPGKQFYQKQFYFNAVVANTCYDFLKSYVESEISVKWPNDLYWRDRKAGGILIENKLMGPTWKWAVVGIGLNINQQVFPESAPYAVSLAQITGKSYDTTQLASLLHQQVLKAIQSVHETDFKELLMQYNDHLYLRGTTTRLKRENIVFESCIKSVNEYGQLLTEDVVERKFNFGEVEWVR